jgi:energy-converting hydrogenase A subunit M
MDLQDFIDRKKTLEGIQRSADKLEAQKEHLIERLKKDFDCSSVEEVKSKIAKLKERLNKKQKECDAKSNAFDKKYQHLLDSL